MVQARLYPCYMDTRFVDEALENYRRRTGDLRDMQSLPLSTVSELLKSAQELKRAEGQQQ